ncbi:MAG TPA: TIGR01777 family oxidoreductase [Acidimicrobiales bacterium]|nr:TIGR01777 family oxidoreductase [Acidimicrobiales bacterium]
MTEPITVAITGSSGLIGTALGAALRSAGHRVRPVVRRAPAGPDEIAMDGLDLTGVDAVVHLAGEGIAEKRWTPEQKSRIRDSRLEGTAAVAAAVAAAGVPVLLSGSGIHFYGDRGDDVLTEDEGPGTGFLPELCVEWEAATQPAADAGARVALLRTGIVLTPKGGALKKMLPLFKLGLGGRMGSGRQWVPWITLDDHVRATMHLLANDLRGPFNLVAPNPVRNQEQAKTIGRVLRRPAILPTPSFGPKLLLGSELAETLLDDSIRAVPHRLTESGFEPTHPTLESALRALLGR